MCKVSVIGPEKVKLWCNVFDTNNLVLDMGYNAHVVVL